MDKRKKRRIIGVKFDPDEMKRSVRIKLDPQTAETLFPKKKGKDAYDYIKEFLQSEEKYEEIMNAIVNLIHSTLTDEERNSCPCSDKNRVGEIPDNEKSCATQTAQFQFAYFLSAQDFVRTVLYHENIYNDKEALKELTINYFNCFEFLPGVVFFDLDKLVRYSLNANFKALSKLFEGSEILNYLKGINHSINQLAEEEVDIDLFEREDEKFVKLQKRFLENKEKYLRSKLDLADREGRFFDKRKELKKMNIRPNRTDLAYFSHYLHETKTKITKNPFPSVGAWEEIGAKFEKNPKNIQKVYNEINSNREKRLRKRRDNNLTYVIENMLTDFPEALKLALDERKIAQLNW